MFPDFLRTDLFFLMLVAASMLSVFFIVLSKKASWLFWYFNTLAFFVAFLFFIALRPFDAGNDTSAYVNTYDALYSFSSAWETGANYYGSQDPLFWPLVYLLKAAGVSGEDFILVVSMLSGFLLWLSFSFYVSKLGIKYHYSSFFVFLVLQSYAIVYLGNHVRSSLALPFVIFFFSFVATGRYYLAAVFLTLAGSIHFSNIVFVPLLLIAFLFFRDGKDIRGKHYFFSLVCAVFFSILVPEILPKISGASNLYFQAKFQAYSEKVFEIESIYSAVTFWQLIAFSFIFLWLGADKSHAPYFYCLCVVIAISFLPKVAERYFVHALFLAPPLLYVGIRKKFGEKKAFLGLSSFYALLGALVISRGSVVYTLGISSLLWG